MYQRVFVSATLFAVKVLNYCPKTYFYVINRLERLFRNVLQHNMQILPVRYVYQYTSMFNRRCMYSVRYMYSISYSNIRVLMRE